MIAAMNESSLSGVDRHPKDVHLDDRMELSGFDEPDHRMSGCE
jgi:hypothetical protein